MRTGAVYGVNSSMIVINAEKFFLGEQKADGIEKGDTVEFESDPNNFLKHLKLLEKAAPAAKKTTKPAAKPAAAGAPPNPGCKYAPCPDGKNHFVFEKRRQRWECESIGIDNPNLSKCPLAHKKPDPILPDKELDEKARNAGFGASTKADPPQQISGLFVNHSKKTVTLNVDGSETTISADPALVKYLESKESKVVKGQSVTIELEDRRSDGKGFVATLIGPGPDVETSPPAEQPAGQQSPPPTGSPDMERINREANEHQEKMRKENEARKAAQAQNQAARPAAPGATPSFHKARRSAAKLRVGLCGTAGCGKSMGALLMGFGIEGPIAVIDTENSSAELYAHMGEYDVCVLQAPFTPQKYTDAIHAAERAGYSVIIIDSLTHAWAGEGGLLDLKDNITKNSKSGNSWAAWKDVTPLHRNLVEAMLQSPCHIIATMRSKTEYVIDTDDRGKSFPRKIGMAPVQREGMDYEFTLVFDIDAAHIASASKDRTSLFTGKSFQISVETGRQLKDWLNTESPGGA